MPECQGRRPPLLAETVIEFQRPEKEVDKDNSANWRIFGRSGSPDAIGSFVVRNLGPGKYLFEPRFYARYWYLQSITTAAAKPPGKVDAVANWTVLKSGDQLTSLTITLVEGAASIRGRMPLADAATPAPGHAFFLIPAEEAKADDVLHFFVTTIAADAHSL